MSDEKLKPSDRIPEAVQAKPAEAPVNDAVISGQSNQQNWRAMDEQHKQTLEESHTAIGVPQDKRPAVKSKLEIVDDQAPQSRGLMEDVGQFVAGVGKGLSDAGEGILAAGKFVNDAVGMVDCASVEQPASFEDFAHVMRPHYGKEDEYISYSDCKTAGLQFRQLSQYLGHRPDQVDPALIAAVIRLEQKWLIQVKDTGLDNYISNHPEGGIAGKQHSIGPAQMRMSTIEQLVKDYPYELNRFRHEPLKHALEVKNAPYFVAGYFACIIDHIVDKHHQRPDFVPTATWAKVCRLWEQGERNKALICAYNDNGGQYQMVSEQLKIIKERH